MMTDQATFLDFYAEQTPNPETMKFVCNRLLLQDQAVDFPTREAAQSSPLARSLYEFSFVNGVFIMNNFVTITRQQGVEWDSIIPIVKEFLKAYVGADEPILSAEPTTKTVEAANDAPVSNEDAVVIAQIQEILDTYIKPAVETDGGMISFKSFQQGVVTVELKGSCSGCPSSSITLKRGIEGMLTRMVPQVTEVVAE